MPEYRINTELYEKALSELMTQWRRQSPNLSADQIEQSAKSIFHHSWSSAVNLHESWAPLSLPEPEPVLNKSRQLNPEAAARVEKMMRELRAKMDSSNARHRELLNARHRVGLISLFTMENGVSQSTAEQIVDGHILTHKK